MLTNYTATYFKWDMVTSDYHVIRYLSLQGVRVLQVILRHAVATYYLTPYDDNIFPFTLAL